LEALILNPDSSPLSRNIEDYPEGIIIPIDKPYRWTSADVIRKVKFAAIRHFGKKNLKVGHAGTLDPLATGVLLVCIGKATKLAETLQSHDKEYVAGITFGATTPSYDLEKEIDRFFPHEHITSESVEAALPAFIGEQDQIAPLFSAKSVDGIRAYELARKLYRTMGRGDSDDPHLSDDRHPLAGGGMSSPSLPSHSSDSSTDIDEAAKELIRVSRINITELELLEFTDSNVSGDGGFENRATPLAAGGGAHEVGGVVFKTSASETASSSASSRINVTDNSALGLPRAVVRMACSKGTYVRAFARDLGEALGSGAHLDSLQRSRSGIFRVENALTVEQAIECLKQ
jgi:tRNA pseudouridine55 synthase